MAAHTVYIGIGSNLDNPANHVRLAISQLAQLPLTRLKAQSSLYLTAPIEADGNDYVNAVACILTALTPEKLLEQLHHLENASGRERTYRNAPRTLDLDILLYDDLQMKSASLTLPHPRMTKRAFVLVPLLEIAPAIVIPGKGAAYPYLEHVQNQPITLLKT
ncbi:MAG: 2-amino-4-hydroxy-6-hydroxymethyldihydropteridine diphosphokinase [Betaproteobacteria bacterium]|nr:2-amino-4-hydroxy-6-hydroxymethyldihydropteridine diphosphokinase [Betaproteobacteria bacterium]